MSQESGVKASYLTPLINVADIERSIRFYQKLGLVTIDTDRAEPLGWARMQCEGGALMFVRSEQPVNVSGVPFLFYLYTPDLPALREDLIAGGIDVPPIKRPGYMPSGEVSLKDPDGYHVLIGHWSDAENQAWLERIREKP